MSLQWDPPRYLAYADERSRGFLDLLARVGAESPTTVVDLGCGPGTLTAVLARRWPAATVLGVDSSPQMIEAATRSILGVRFELRDLREWATEADPVDVVIANAALQWVPGHLHLLPALVERLRPGGWFAGQVPGNFDQPSHTIRAELAAEAPYAPYVADVATPASHEPEEYLRVLQSLGCRVDVWETTYLHVLHGADPVFAWVAGTGARPTLQALPDPLRGRFESEFKRRLRGAYPDDGHGVVLRFRRIFWVAQRPEAAG